MHHQVSKSVDTYHLINDLLVNNHLGDLQFILDNQLPVIIGDPVQLEEIFTSYIEETILEFHDKRGTLYFKYINDPIPTISVNLISHTSTIETQAKESTLVKKVHDFELSISKSNHEILLGSENIETKKHNSTKQKTG